MQKRGEPQAYSEYRESLEHSLHSNPAIQELE